MNMKNWHRWVIDSCVKCDDRFEGIMQVKMKSQLDKERAILMEARKKMARERAMKAIQVGAYIK